MTELTAKPIVNNQYWVITDGSKKVGNVVANNNGFEVKLNGDSRYFSSADDIKKITNITFESVKTPSKLVSPLSDYPTPPKIYNSVLDVKRKLHLFTETAASKCYHVAGWFTVNQNGVDQVIFCPKYIFIQRYSYRGPFMTENDATAALNT